MSYRVEYVDIEGEKAGQKLAYRQIFSIFRGLELLLDSLYIVSKVHI